MSLLCLAHPAIHQYAHIAHTLTQIRPAFGSSGVGHGGSVAPAAHATKMQRQALVRHQASLGGPGAYTVPQVTHTPATRSCLFSKGMRLNQAV